MRYVIFFLSLTVFFPSKAHAYIDPGVGSMLIQVALGAIFGLMIWFRESVAKFFKRIKSLLNKEK